MKKLLLLVAILFMVSCTPESIEEHIPECTVVYEVTYTAGGSTYIPEHDIFMTRAEYDAWLELPRENNKLRLTLINNPKYNIRVVFASTIYEGVQYYAYHDFERFSEVCN